MDAAPLVALVIIGLAVAFLAGVVLNDALTPASSTQLTAASGAPPPARTDPVPQDPAEDAPA